MVFWHMLMMVDSIVFHFLSYFLCIVEHFDRYMLENVVIPIQFHVLLDPISLDIERLRLYF